MILAQYSIPIYVLMVISIMAFVLIAAWIIKNQKTKLSSKALNLEAFYDALGGKDNLISTRANISKIHLKLKNKSKITPIKLKELGVSGIIAKSDEVVIIIGKRSNEISRIINEDLSS